MAKIKAKIVSTFCLLILTNLSFADEPKIKRTIRMRIEFIQKKINPIENVDVSSVVINRQIFDGLYVFSKDTKLNPSLVSSHSISPLGNKINIKLKKGIYFHDGSEITSNDVKKSLERSIIFYKEEVRWGMGDVVGFDDFVMGAAKELKGIKIRSKYELTFDLSTSFPRFLQVLATPYFLISKFENKEFIGSGAYKLKMIKSNKVVLEKISTIENAPDLIEFLAADVKKLDLKTIKNKFDLSEIPIWLKDEVESNHIREFNFLHTVLLIMNQENSLFDTAEKRCLFKDRLRNSFLRSDYGFISMNEGAPFGWGIYEKEFKKVKLKKKKTREKVELLFSNSSATFHSSYNQKIVKDIKKKANVNLVFKSDNIGNLVEKLKKKKYDAVILGFVPDYMDAESLLIPVVQSKQQYNFSGYSNTLVDTLLTLGRELPNNQSRSKIMQKVFDQIEKDCPVSFIGIQKHRFYISNEWVVPKLSNIGISTILFKNIGRKE